MSITIKTFTPPQLLEYINSDEFSNLENYPITKHRALSHINNPRSSETDKILYIAYQNNKIVGYRLIMVDQINIDGGSEKIGWYSCVWVHPQKRGLGIAKKLVKISLSDWENKIIFQGPVSASKNLYTSTNNFNERFIYGLRAYSRFDLNQIISNKIPSLNCFSFLFKAIDIFCNLFIDNVSKKFPCPQNIKIINEFDNNIENFIHQYQENNLFKRNKEDFNWIVSYPWVLESNIIDPVSKNYHFSSVSKRFKNLNVAFYNITNEIEGFLTLQIRDNHLIVYNSFFKPHQIPSIVEFIFHTIKSYKTSSFSVYDKELIKYIKKNKNPFLFSKELKRGFYYSKVFDKYFKKNPQLSFEAGDGDMIFT